MSGCRLSTIQCAMDAGTVSPLFEDCHRALDLFADLLARPEMVKLTGVNLDCTRPSCTPSSVDCAGNASPSSRLVSNRSR
jgi:hypothetical protein